MLLVGRNILKQYNQADKEYTSCFTHYIVPPLLDPLRHCSFFYTISSQAMSLHFTSTLSSFHTPTLPPSLFIIFSLSFCLFIYFTPSSHFLTLTLTPLSTSPCSATLHSSAPHPPLPSSSSSSLHHLISSHLLTIRYA